MENINELLVAAYEVPTDLPESDGTLAWNSTTLVLVEVKAAGKTGIGYTYADAAISTFIYKTLRPLVIGKHPYDIPGIFAAMITATRNEGWCGMAYMAISAIDIALWDLKAKMLGLPLCKLIGSVRNEALIYGSGGFTSYTDAELEDQLGAWVGAGFGSVKMKIGRHPEKDVLRVKKARQAIGSNTNLFVDANGAYDIKQAIAYAEKFEEYNVTWFEEPVPSNDLKGLNFIKGHAPAGIKIAAGEYGYAPDYFLNMLNANAIDVLQADATRCGGITGFLKAAYLCQTFHLPFSFHCAPSLHLHAALCTDAFCIGEYFHDHARIENMLLDGAPQPQNGYLKPDLSRPGMGFDFKHQDAVHYKIA